MTNCECSECDYQRRLESLIDDACKNIAALNEENFRLRQALQEIANEDYRGNRPWSATIAFKALEGKRGCSAPCS